MEVLTNTSARDQDRPAKYHDCTAGGSECQDGAAGGKEHQGEG